MPTRVVVLVSGAGTLLESLLHASATPGYPADVVAVGADRPGIAGLHRAERAGLPTFAVPLNAHPDRASWDAALAAAAAEHEPDLVVSAGFMKILGPAFLQRFAGRTLNTHPALLPAFPGAHAVTDALAHGVRVSGATVHLVDAGVDTGPILAQQAVEVLPDDTAEGLHERIKTGTRPTTRCRELAPRPASVPAERSRPAAHLSGRPGVPSWCKPGPAISLVGPRVAWDTTIAGRRRNRSDAGCTSCWT